MNLIREKQSHRIIAVWLFLIGCIVWQAAYPATGGKEKRKKQEEVTLTADGPYLFYQPDGKVRMIAVDANGQLTDTTYTTLPQDFTFRVTDHRGRVAFDVTLHPVERPAATYSMPD